MSCLPTLVPGVATESDVLVPKVSPLAIVLRLWKTLLEPMLATVSCWDRVDVMTCSFRPSRLMIVLLLELICLELELDESPGVPLSTSREMVLWLSHSEVCSPSPVGCFCQSEEKLK